VQLSKNDVYHLCNGQRAANFKFTEKAYARINIHMNCYFPMSEEYYERQMVAMYGKDTPAYDAAMKRFGEYNDIYNQVEDTSLAEKLYSYDNAIYGS